MGQDKTVVSDCQNKEDGNNGGHDHNSKWAGWRVMSDEEFGDGVDNDASEDVAEVEGGGQDVSGRRRRG